MRSVEYSHVYAGHPIQVTSEEVEAVGHLAGDDAQLVVMVDDYNHEGCFDPTGIASELEALGVCPDRVFGEADFAYPAIPLLTTLTGRVGDRQRRWTEKNGKLSCALLTASWYLSRLGVLPSPQDRLHRLPLKPAATLVNVLDCRYEDSEAEAREIIANSPSAWALDRIRYEWLATPVSA